MPFNVSILGMGTMRLPLNGTNPDIDSSISLLKTAMSKGINLFDVGTFYGNGQCEEVFGRCIEGTPRDKLILTGKNSSHQNNSVDWTASLYNTLHLFHSDHLDLYLLHFLTWDKWSSYFLQKNILQQVTDTHKNGLFRFLGFSSHDKPDNVRKLIDTDLFSAVILPFNLLNRSYETVMQYAFDKGLGVIAMNPLAAGVLATSDLYLSAFQDEYQKQLASHALNFVLSQPFIHCVLSGMETEEIIDENCNTVEQKRLSEEDISVLNESLESEKVNRYIPCTGCQYCLPCPQGIDIPKIIGFMNQYSIVHRQRVYHREYSLLPVTAECCIDCNSCVEKCTYHIPIPRIMGRAAELFSS